MKSFANYSKNLHYYANLTFYFFFEQKNTGNFPVGFFCLNNVICFKKKIYLQFVFETHVIFGIFFVWWKLNPNILLFYIFCLFVLFVFISIPITSMRLKSVFPIKYPSDVGWQYRLNLKKKLCFFKLIIYFGKKKIK